MKPGSNIAWEFRLEKKDIGLSATFQRWDTDSQTEPTSETIIEYAKIFAEHGVVKGSYTAEGQFAKGVITFAWDNSFSKMCVLPKPESVCSLNALTSHTTLSDATATLPTAVRWRSLTS